VSKRQSFSVEEAKALFQILGRMAAAGAALPATRVAGLFRVRPRTVRRWVSLGKVERLPGGGITARSLLDLFVLEYVPTAQRNLFTQAQGNVDKEDRLA